MVFTQAEIDVLRLAAWCKDIPAAGTEILPSQTVSLLSSLKLLRKSRCGLSWRPTPLGYSVLQAAGLSYEADRHYRGKGPALLRRLDTASAVSFFWRYGADVFLSSPYTEKGKVSFLPSFALRRKTASNLLGGARMTGFLYTDDTVFIPYFLHTESEGLYASVEQRTFRAEVLSCGRSPFALYTGEGDWSRIVQTVIAQTRRKAHSTTDSYIEAMQKFRCPAGIMPLDEGGLRQLRILSTPGYRVRLLRRLLGKDYLPADTGLTDGRSKAVKGSFLVGIDLDLPRFDAAIRQHAEKTHILLLCGQMPAAQIFLQGKNAVLHPVETEIVEQLLGLPPELPALNETPFQTPEGAYVHVPFSS